MKFCDRVKLLRKENNLTQEALANALYVSRQTISSWETGRNLPDIQMIVLIHEKFNISLDDLIIGEKDVQKKLINDGSENKKVRMNFLMVIVATFLLLLGSSFVIIKGLSVEYIDSNGILHENFFLLPIGFLMIFSSFIIFSVAGLKNVIYKTKENKVKKIHKN